METPTAPISQSNVIKAGTKLSSESPDSSTLLNRKDYGLHVTGRVDSVSSVDFRSGKTQAGKDYSFYQQVLTLALGGQMVEVIFRSEKEPSGSLTNHDLDDVIRIKVEKPRIFNARVSFDAAI